MNAYPNISYIAKLISEPTRAIILESLMGGQALPAGELAYMAKVSHPTVSSHLSKLVEGDLLKVEQFGRHRYYKLANEQVAEVIEKLGTIAPPVHVRSLKQSDEMKQVRSARTCYDHLAGELGVSITEALLDQDLIILKNDQYEVTNEGGKWFENLGITINDMGKSRRVFAKPCLDWSERRYHISGWLGAAIATHFLDQKWMIKSTTNRSVRLTEEGTFILKDKLGLEF